MKFPIQSVLMISIHEISSVTFEFCVGRSHLFGYPLWGTVKIGVFIYIYIHNVYIYIYM